MLSKLHSGVLSVLGLASVKYYAETPNFKPDYLFICLLHFGNYGQGNNAVIYLCVRKSILRLGQPVYNGQTIKM